MFGHYLLPRSELSCSRKDRKTDHYYSAVLAK